MNNIAVFDIDGVVADFEGRLNFHLHTKFDRLATCNRSVYSLEERYANKSDVLKEALEFTADPNSYYGLVPDMAIIGFIQRIYKDGYSIYFVSGRPATVENFTRRWLKKHLDCEFRLACGVSNKADYLLNCEWNDLVDFAVDDSPMVVKDLVGCGFNAYIYDQPWNQGIFPRIYVRSDQELMVWEDESVEAQTFWVEA